jgi:hypothetical protein
MLLPGRTDNLTIAASKLAEGDLAEPLGSYAVTLVALRCSISASPRPASRRISAEC